MNWKFWKMVAIDENCTVNNSGATPPNILPFSGDWYQRCVKCLYGGRKADNVIDVKYINNGQAEWLEKECPECGAIWFEHVAPADALKGESLMASAEDKNLLDLAWLMTDKK